MPKCLRWFRRILDELQETLGVGHAAKPATSAGITEEITVGPRGSDAQFHEIADAVAHANPGTRIRVSAGRYLKPVVIDRNGLAALIRGVPTTRRRSASTSA